MAEAEKDPVKDTFVEAAATLEIEHNKVKAEIKDINHKLELAKPLAPQRVPGQKTPHVTPAKPTDAQKALTSQLHETQALDRAITGAESYAKTIAEDGKDAPDNKVQGFYSQIKSALKYAENTSHKDIVLDVRRDTNAVLPHPNDDEQKKLGVDIAFTEKMRNADKKPENAEKETLPGNDRARDQAAAKTVVAALNAMHDKHPNFYDVDINKKQYNQFNTNDKGRPEFKKQFDLAKKAAAEMVQNGKPVPEKVKEFHTAMDAAINELDEIKKRAPEEFKDNPGFRDTVIKFSDEIKGDLGKLKKDINNVEGLKEPAHAAVDKLINASKLVALPPSEGNPSAPGGSPAMPSNRART